VYKWVVFLGVVLSQGFCALLGIGDKNFGNGMVAGAAVALLLVGVLERNKN
jgi:hypothetical protein